MSRLKHQLDVLRSLQSVAPAHRGAEWWTTPGDWRNAKTWPLETFLLHLLEQELDGRQQRRIERLLRAIPSAPGQDLDTFDQNRLPLRIRRLLPATLCRRFDQPRRECALLWVARHWENAFSGSIGLRMDPRPLQRVVHTHLQAGRRLLRAKRDYELERELRRLDRFHVVILDDIGYVQQSREEMEVLFTFLAERYERRSVVITSNLVFSEWEQIFKDPLTTAAAIDRVVHHSLIIEFGQEMTSYRAQEAAKRNQKRIKRR